MNGSTWPLDHSILDNNLNDQVPYYDFFHAFGYGDREPVFFRTFNDKKKRGEEDYGRNTDMILKNLAFIMKGLHDENAHDRGVFFIVNGGGNDDESVKKKIKRPKAHFVDIDDYSFEEQVDKINEFGLEPSIIVKTNKSLHIYWLTDDNAEMDNFRPLQMGLIQFFGSDPVIKNESRVMRVYGFEHRKQDPVMVKLIKFNPEIRYSQKEIAKKLISHGITKPNTGDAHTGSNINSSVSVSVNDKSVPVGQGHYYVVKKIGEFLDRIGNNVNDESILALVESDFMSKYEDTSRIDIDQFRKKYLKTITKLREKHKAEQADPGFYSYALKAWKDENPGKTFDTSVVSWDEVREAGRRAKEKEKEFSEGLAEWKRKHPEEAAASAARLRQFCADKGIQYSESLTCTYDFDDSITKVIDSETGEILFDSGAAGADHAQAASIDEQKAASIGATVNQAAPAAAQEEKKSLTVGGFDDVEIKPTDYLFYPWFPRGKLTAVQGDSSSSKSTFMYAVGALVTTGSDLMGSPCEDPGNVMFITIEDDASDIKIAFMDAGGDISKLKRIVDREQIASLDLSPKGAAMIDKIIKDQKIKLLVLDPLQQFLCGDMNKANETRPQLGRLMNIAADNNISIVFLEHMGKDTSKAALHRGLGSVDIGAATRSIIQIVTDPQDDFFKIAFTVKNNTAAMYDTQKAIRYQVKDHPENYDHVTKKRLRFHGHAEFVELIPEYNDRLFRKAVRKKDEEEANELCLAIEYAKDPLVITARNLLEQNPGGMFIGADDLIQKITYVCGRCPYDQSKSSTSGIYSRAARLRAMMIDNDGIQIDIQSNAVFPKAYTWENETFNPEHNRTRGFKLTAVPKADDDAQQLKV